MFVIQNVLVSEELATECFLCDLQKCKGACCVEGDLGAPLESSELKELETIFPKITSYLTAEGLQVLKTEGLYVLDTDGDYSTPTIGGRECAYSFYDGQGVLQCGIEKAYQDGKISFRKPISCHLYPIRITQYPRFVAVNYHQWSICSPACALGKATKLPLYVFLKEALTQKFGAPWYAELASQIEAYLSQKS